MRKYDDETVWKLVELLQCIRANLNVGMNDQNQKVQAYIIECDLQRLGFSVYFDPKRKEQP